MPAFNPGEPVWDQNTGDVVIDPTTGDAVIVVDDSENPELALWTDPATGAVYQRGDVANAVYFATNTRLGEVTRDASAGVDFVNVIFAPPAENTDELTIAEIQAAAMGVPGVAAMVSARRASFDLETRAVVFLFTIRKRARQGLSALAVSLQG